MSKEVSKISKEQKEKIIDAIIELCEGETGILLQDCIGLYFMALEHYLMNDPETREEKTCTFLHLHNFLAKLDMIIQEKEGCYQLAV
ncbi:hypothetical protein [Allomuricauda sp. ARW1Y1]|jgi:hypothetical protein|uniref:hypothetical protein n=1 Tax=Allomuricauda sp. ARW1Y1 TaxID=2663843 RepID=UPI0015CD650F|nr:hypothetical protein [Muricauda sp. ARW1Y1]NYJ27504.1 hypothetical protein [Muricauda sp. ARW1Y1]